MLKVLDSTVIIDYLRGRPVVERLDALERTGDVVGTTAINVEEVVRGLREGESSSAGRFFRGLVVLSVDAQVAWRAGTWRREFAMRGVTLSQADCLIAATAWIHAGTVVTGNPRHFPMSEVDVDHWPVAT